MGRGEQADHRGRRRTRQVRACLHDGHWVVHWRYHRPLEGTLSLSYVIPLASDPHLSSVDYQRCEHSAPTPVPCRDSCGRRDHRVSSRYVAHVRVTICRSPRIHIGVPFKYDKVCCNLMRMLLSADSPRVHRRSRCTRSSSRTYDSRPLETISLVLARITRFSSTMARPAKLLESSRTARTPGVSYVTIVMSTDQNAQGHHPQMACSWSPDSTSLVTSAADCTVKLCQSPQHVVW